VLIHPCLQIVSDAGVKHGVCPVGHYINVVLFVHGYIIRDCGACFEIASALVCLAMTKGGVPRNDKGGRASQ
jgi:hypothetical protein